MRRRSRARNTHSRSKRPSKRPPLPAGGPTSTTAELTTVAWMLAMLSALLSEVLGILIRLLSVQFGASHRLELLSNVLLLVALVAGLVTLVLTPITLHVRSIRPPSVITISAVVIGAIPLVTVVLLMWR